VGGKGLVLWAGRGLGRKQEGEEEWVGMRKKRAGKTGVRKLVGRKGAEKEAGRRGRMGSNEKEEDTIGSRKEGSAETSG
jgi:hypothetical protein